MLCKFYVHVTCIYIFYFILFARIEKRDETAAINEFKRPRKTQIYQKVSVD